MWLAAFERVIVPFECGYESKVKLSFIVDCVHRRIQKRDSSGFNAKPSRLMNASKMLA